ncbi:hypothetical protein LTR85_000625 [Meristemomyces frigidus]|nr:hypothetical protein LTR85_000625 [Meristemomyces frigidus]
MDRKLLLAILKHHDVSVDTGAVAQELTSEDQPCTAMAVTKRLQRIRDMIKKGNTGGDEDTPKPKATPRKRGKAGESGETPTKKAKTTKGGKGKAADANGGDDEEATKEAGVKQEEGDEEDVLA